MVLVRFADVDAENNGFDILVGTGEPFSYVGNRIISITDEQLKLLGMNHVKFKVINQTIHLS